MIDEVEIERRARALRAEVFGELVRSFGGWVAARLRGTAAGAPANI